MSEFLKELFSGAESGFLTLTQLFDERSPAIEQLGLDEIDKVDDFIERRRVTLYYNIGLSRARLDRGARGGKADVASVSCLWMDIDLPKASSKKNYPPLDHITASLSDMPLKYTALVHTGGGLHVYWFFKEPVCFADLSEAEKFEATLSKPWLTLFKVKLARYGQYSIDAVHDVSRMMRVPGSWHKNGRQCVVEGVDYALRYSPEDFAPYLEQIDIENLLPTKILPKFRKTADGKMSLRRLEALLANSPSFKKVWERKNTLGDDASKVDASIIRHAVDAGWGDDEIADLVYTFNEKYTPERLEKVLRPEPVYGNYIGRVISFARTQASKSRSSIKFGEDDQDEPPRLDDALPEELPEETGGAEPKEEAPPVDERLEDLKKLSRIFELPVARWIQIGREQPLYTMVLADGTSIRIGGDAAVVDGPMTFTRRLYANFPAKKIKPFTKAEWLNALYGLGRVVEIVDAPEVTISEMALAGICQYLQEQRVVAEKMRDHGLKNGQAYYDGKNIHIYLPTLVKHLNMHGGGHKWNNVEMVAALTTLGFKRETIAYSTSTGRSTKSYWSKSAEQFMDVIGPCQSSKTNTE